MATSKSKASKEPTDYVMRHPDTGTDVTVPARLLDSYVAAGYSVVTDATPVVVPRAPAPTDSGTDSES